jgi:hypothetical protein
VVGEHVEHGPELVLGVIILDLVGSRAQPGQSQDVENGRGLHFVFDLRFACGLDWVLGFLVVLG